MNNGWRKVYLDDICTLVAGFAFKSKDFGDYKEKVIKIGDIKPPFVDYSSESGIDINSYDKEKLKKYQINKGDFVFAMTGATIGKVGRYIEDVPSYLNQRVLTFKHKVNTNKDFLYYSLCSDSFTKYVINHIDSDSAQPNISANTLGKFVLNIPDLPTQQRIASILSSLDAKIENNNKINAKLEEIAQNLFKEWFVDFGPFKNGKFVESELGLIPEGWRVGKLSEIGKIVGGSTPSKNNPEFYTTNGIAWITPKDLSITKAKFTSRGEIDITEAGYKSTSTKLMPKGSVLFSSRAPIGYLTIAKNDICTNQGFKSVVPTTAGTGFIYYLLKYLTPDIENKAVGTTFKEASGSLMSSLDVIIPTKEILDEFESILDPIFEKQELLESESTKLTTIRDTLLPKLMSGEIEV